MMAGSQAKLCICRQRLCLVALITRALSMLIQWQASAWSDTLSLYQSADPVG